MRVGVREQCRCANSRIFSVLKFFIFIPVYCPRVICSWLFCVFICFFNLKHFSKDAEYYHKFSLFFMVLCSSCSYIIFPQYNRKKNKMDMAFLLQQEQLHFVVYFHTVESFQFFIIITYIFRNM